MTAEIAILNKAAVALAADSLVTVTSGRGDKTYNTSNKLFTLSKIHPVGVLTYGDTEINRMPVDIIMKEYRERLAEDYKSSIQEYSDSFIGFVSNFSPKGPDVEQRTFFWIAKDHADSLSRKFKQECRQANVQLGATFTSDMNAALARVVARF